MSRNIGTTRCDVCGETPTLQEEPRLLTEGDAGIYFREFKGMMVANAECSLCKTKYLAWVKEADKYRHEWSFMVDSWAESTKRIGFYDLSYRNSFDDEPGPGDIEVFRVGTHSWIYHEVPQSLPHFIMFSCNDCNSDGLMILKGGEKFIIPDDNIVITNHCVGKTNNMTCNELQAMINVMKC